MPTLKEIQEENARLRAKLAVRQDMKKQTALKKDLIRENKRLKHPKIYDVSDTLKRGVREVGKVIGSEVKLAAKKAAKKKPRKKFTCQYPGFRF